MERRRLTERTTSTSSASLVLVIACIAPLRGWGLVQRDGNGEEGDELGYGFGCLCIKRKFDGAAWNGANVLVAR